MKVPYRTTTTTTTRKISLVFIRKTNTNRFDFGFIFSSVDYITSDYFGHNFCLLQKTLSISSEILLLLDKYIDDRFDLTQNDI